MVNNEMALEDETVVPSEAAAAERYFVRLNYSERVQHIIFAGCFFVLVITGFMLKLPGRFSGGFRTNRRSIVSLSKTFASLGRDTDDSDQRVSCLLPFI